MNRIPTLFKYIQENVTKKKTLKELMDTEINFADIQGGYVRILDEGAVPYRDGSIRLYIPKGEIERFVMNLSDDYVGYINIGHLDLQEVPLVLGTWTKKDLRIVNLKGGFKGLEVKPQWFKESPIYQHFIVQKIPLSLSVEMPRILNERLSQEKGYPVLNEVFVAGFSVVGSPANASSYNIELKGEDEMDFSKIKTFLNGKSETLEDASEEKVEETIEEVKEETTEESSEVETKEKDEKEVEETVEETIEDEKVSLSEEDLIKLEKFMDNYQKMEEKLSDMKKENESLKNKIKSLEGEKEKLSDKATEVTKEKESLESRVYTTLDRLEKFMNKENTVETSKQSKKYGSFQVEGEE